MCLRYWAHVGSTCNMRARFYIRGKMRHRQPLMLSVVVLSLVVTFMPNLCISRDQLPLHFGNRLYSQRAALLLTRVLSFGLPCVFSSRPATSNPGWWLRGAFSRANERVIAGPTPGLLIQPPRLRSEIMFLWHCMQLAVTWTECTWRLFWV